MDRGAWWATVHGITKSSTWLKQFSTHAKQKQYYNTLTTDFKKKNGLHQKNIL